MNQQQWMMLGGGALALWWISTRNAPAAQAPAISAPAPAQLPIYFGNDGGGLTLADLQTTLGQAVDYLTSSGILGGAPGESKLSDPAPTAPAPAGDPGGYVSRFTGTDAVLSPTKPLRVDAPQAPATKPAPLVRKGRQPATEGNVYQRAVPKPEPGERVSSLVYGFTSF